MPPTAADVRSALDHPVIDADGHGIEYLPWFRDLLADEGGPAAVDAWDVVENGARLTRALDVDTKLRQVLDQDPFGLGLRENERMRIATWDTP